MCATVTIKASFEDWDLLLGVLYDDARSSHFDEKIRKDIRAALGRIQTENLEFK